MDRASVAYLDTHVLIALRRGETAALGKEARRLIDRCRLLASPAAVLELQMLFEIGRLRQRPPDLISGLSYDVGLEICDLPFSTVAQEALGETWTRDPFDRLIVANAKARGAWLVTKDPRIAGHYARAAWD